MSAVENYFLSYSRLKQLWCAVLNTADAFALATQSGVTQRINRWFNRLRRLISPLRVQGCTSPAAGVERGLAEKPLAEGVGTRSSHRVRALNKKCLVR
jgi:hypothetical protein